MPLQNKSWHELKFRVSFSITEEMTPLLNLLVFFVHNDEIIPDSYEFKINKCLKNKVKLL